MANTWENYPEGPDSEPAPETPTSWAVYGDDGDDITPDPSPDFDRHDRPSWRPAIGAFLVVVMLIGFLGMLLSLRPQSQQAVKIEGYARPGLPNVRSVTLPEQVDDWQRGTLTRGQGPYLVVFTDYTRDHQDVTILGSISSDPDPLRGMQRPNQHPDAEVACDTVTGTTDRRVCVIPLDEGQLTVTSDDSALSIDDLGTFTAELARTLT